MKRVYTDERFPGFEVINHGRGTFEITESGKVIDTFESWENPDGTVSEPFAARRASDYFERWAGAALNEAGQRVRTVALDGESLAQAVVNHLIET